MIRTLDDVESTLGAETLRLRLEAADREALVLDRVLELMREGLSRSAALRTVMPDCKVESQMKRLRAYQVGGGEGLVSRRYGPPAPLKMTAAVKGGLQVLAKSDPAAGAQVLAERLSAMFGISVAISSVHTALKELGLARPRGRRWPKSVAPAAVETTAAELETLPLAGAELLKALDEHLGAVAALTASMGEHLDALSAPEGPVEDDGGNRDDRGRFLPAYNEPAARTEPELGARFNTAEKRRAVKDLPAMRVAGESTTTRHRKNLGLVLLPCVVRSTRWSELAHWRGELLDELIGFAYQPSTLDKYLRELKLAGCAEVSRQSVAEFWLGAEGPTRDAATGAVVLYVDASTKPVWTHHWTRATKVSKTGRIQPAVTTVTLHSGAGTPMLYRSYSGGASLPAEIGGFLAEHERNAGEGTVRRVVVMDRGAHSVAMFKELATTWGFVVPLRAQVVGPTGRFEDVQPWEPYGQGPDEVCNAKLWLKDNRKGEPDLLVRAVGRRRHRTGKVAWFATLLPVEEFSATDVIRLYFERWPAQEHVYRDGSGAVGLDVHHGFGKLKVDNVAVIDRHDKLLGQLRRLDTTLETDRAKLVPLLEQQGQLQAAFDHTAPQVRQRRAAFDAAFEAGRATSDHAALRAWEGCVDDTREKLMRLGREVANVEARVRTTQAARERKQTEANSLATKRRIFTVDVELDEIVMAFKFTFMNLCRVLMRDYLHVDMETDTMIDSVLTLAGERITTASTETVRIYRRPRDSRAMVAVGRACAELTALRLRRGDRLLSFELVDPPPRRWKVDPSEVGNRTS
jgi:hypothetical protein